MPWRSLRSPPAQKARSPAPVTTTARQVSGLANNSVNISRRSRPIWVFIALAKVGRFNVTWRTPSAGRPSATVSYCSRIMLLCRIVSTLHLGAEFGENAPRIGSGDDVLCLDDRDPRQGLSAPHVPFRLTGSRPQNLSPWSLLVYRGFRWLDMLADAGRRHHYECCGGC